MKEITRPPETSDRFLFGEPRRLPRQRSVVALPGERAVGQQEEYPHPGLGAGNDSAEMVPKPPSETVPRPPTRDSPEVALKSMGT
jgi:hypothetical protein